MPNVRFIAKCKDGTKVVIIATRRAQEISDRGETVHVQSMPWDYRTSQMAPVKWIEGEVYHIYQGEAPEIAISDDPNRPEK